MKLGISFGGLSLLLWSILPAAFAGGWTSGGGNSVVCFHDPAVVAQVKGNAGALSNQAIPHITFIEAFDLYEAKLKRGFPPKAPVLAEPHAGEAFLDYVERIIARSEISVPALAEIMRNSQKLLPEDHIVLNDHGIQGVQDVNSVGLIDSQNCVLATTAVQYKIEDQFYLHIDERLFFHPAHSEWSKAVLLLHEYLYRFAREKGQLDSRNTRTLIAKLLSNSPNTLQTEVVRLGKDLGFLEYENEESLGFYYHVAPVKAFVDSFWWARFSGSIEYDRYDLTHESPLQTAQQLLRALKSKAQPQTVGQAIAYLKDYPNDDRAAAMLEKLQAFHEARAAAVMDVMQKRHEEDRNQIELSYLTPGQILRFQTAGQRMLRRLEKLALATLTQEKIDWYKNGSGGIRFDTDTGAYTFEDLNMNAVLGDPARQRENDARIKAANEWLRANIRWVLFNWISGEEGASIFGITMPVL